MSALLETEIKAAGLQIRVAPHRVEEYTSGEMALAQRLADPIKKDELEPRGMHDVDCVAGVLTLRKGHRSNKIEDIGAVFATSSPLVIQNTRLWWEDDEHETGISPIVHIRALANLAWLKKPSLSTDFKIQELVALCTATLRPSNDTWRRFLKHLESLYNSQRLTSDEMTAIVVSAMSDRLLREAEMEEEDPEDIDAGTLDEVVERVKISYKAQAEERELELKDEYETKLANASAEAQSNISRAEDKASQAKEAEHAIAELMRQQQLSIERRARKLAKYFSHGLHGAVVAILLIGAVALILGHPFHRGWIGYLIAAAIILFVIFEFVGIIQHVSKIRASIERYLEKCFRGWLLGKPQTEQDSPSE